MLENDITTRLHLMAAAAHDEALQALLIEAADAIEYLRDLLAVLPEDPLH